MTPQTNKTEVPPLSELAKGSFQDIQKYVPSLSLPELLIVGARPLDGHPREGDEVNYFGNAAKGKLRALEAERGSILKAVIGELYPEEQLERRTVRNYLGKTELLISEGVLPPAIFESLETNIKKEILRYRNSIRAFKQDNSHTPGNIDELSHLQSTPVNLTFLLHPEYAGREPHLIAVKTKEYSRIAGKIPAYMIEAYRRERGKPGNAKELKRHINLEEGIIKDIVGLQFVTLEFKDLEMIKEYLFQSDDIRVVGFDDYYMERKGPYHAKHVDARWNPGKDTRQSRPGNSVEVILIELPYFISSNFGPESYWRRMNAQEMGIVDKNIIYGRLKVSPFTPEERQWRDIVKGRIMGILTCDYSPANKQ